jgi:hypothetical protein
MQFAFPTTKVVASAARPKGPQGLLKCHTCKVATKPAEGQLGCRNLLYSDHLHCELIHLKSGYFSCVICEKTSEVTQAITLCKIYELFCQRVTANTANMYRVLVR